jgi:hypothetical protein
MLAAGVGVLLTYAPQGSAEDSPKQADKDGDKFVEPWSLAPGAKKGTATLGPGTGKYKGIDGTLEWEVVTSLPAATGTYNFIGKKRGSYRMP